MGRARWAQRPHPGAASSPDVQSLVFGGNDGVIRPRLAKKMDPAIHATIVIRGPLCDLPTCERASRERTDRDKDPPAGFSHVAKHRHPLS
jgi:hypothetical protein